MKKQDGRHNSNRRRVLKKFGAAAGLAAFPGLASATDPEAVRTIKIDTSGFARVEEANVTFFDDGAVERHLGGHQPADASAAAYSIRVDNINDPQRAEARLVQLPPSEMPEASDDDRVERSTRGGSPEDAHLGQADRSTATGFQMGTSDSPAWQSSGDDVLMDHSGSSNDYDYEASIKLICEKGDRCGCWPEWEVYNSQTAEWTTDWNGCVDAEHLEYWSRGWAINLDSCYDDWTNEDSNEWIDDGTCELDTIREDRFSYYNGDYTNEVVMRHQLDLYDDGSNDWEVTRYDDGGNGCLFHGVEVS